jgi:hypothetical protein
VLRSNSIPWSSVRPKQTNGEPGDFNSPRSSDGFCLRRSFRPRTQAIDIARRHGGLLCSLETLMELDDVLRLPRVRIVSPATFAPEAGRDRLSEE